MLIDLYLKVLGESNTECSEFAHVWSMVSAVGALLERRVKLPFGDNYVDTAGIGGRKKLLPGEISKQ
jgi:hypothetical protein